MPKSKEEVHTRCFNSLEKGDTLSHLMSGDTHTIHHVDPRWTHPRGAMMHPNVAMK